MLFLIYLATPIKTTLYVNIPSGSISNIVQYYKNRGLNINNFDKILIYLMGMPQKGILKMENTEISKIDFIYSITHFKSITKAITIIPGETSYFFLRDFSRKLNLDYFLLKKLFDEKSIFKDGTIIADTYNIPLYMKEKDLINYLISNSISAHKKMSNKILGFYEQEKWKKYVIIASIIQKEAGSNEEMGIVSSVIYNRLKKRMRLQMDGSLNYGKYSHTRVSSKQIKEDNTSFNTYKKRGIPNEAISSIGKEALYSAIYPKDTSYLYFVRDKKTNEHIFSRTYKEHLRNIRQDKN